MAISLEKAIGFHEQALKIRTQRAELLANNLANADTPGFKARDLDFRAMLASTLQADKAGSSVSVRKTDQRHLQLSDDAVAGRVLYRQPLQPSIDGNTVDSQSEIVQFSKNAMDFQTSFMFLNSRIKGLKSAIKGE